MRKGQTSSIDLVLSAVGLLLFIALIIALSLRGSSVPTTYGDPIFDSFGFIDGSRMTTDSIGTITDDDDVLLGRYDATGFYPCVFVVNASGVVEGAGTYGCAPPDVCGEPVEHHVKPVMLINSTGQANESIIGELNVMICRGTAP